ncbi:hypothetical protein [Chitinophaga niabensis]|uniref:Lipoprotein n=1 Tax=Chitinophaga niabensis TaxID=536979 RepID=A0A1N6K6J5_9BACT|nr:hypothetical protein [Chitinophaga niabensis]SIO52200.1 hypothetical protein SAMN04488055_5187 [Chitinophaga niabensis]
MMKPLLFACCLLLSCKQVVRTVEETFHPVAEPTKKPVDPPPSVQHFSMDSSFSITIETEAITQHIEKRKDSSFSVTIETDAVIPSSIQKRIDSTLSVTIKTRSSRLLTDGLLKAEKALRNLPQYAGKEIFIYSSIHFYGDGSIRTMLQHPENPEYIDNYVYQNGAWSAPKPEQVSIKDRIASRLVSLEKIHFTTAAKVAKTYNEKAAEVEGAKPLTSVYISIWDNRVRWYPGTIIGSREKWSIDFDEDGGLRRFERE